VVSLGVVSAGFRAEYRCASQLLRRCQCVASDDARFRCHEGGAAPFAPTAHHLDQLLSKLTDDKRTFAGIAAGLPSVILTTTGAKSGKPRTVALLGIPHPDGVAVVAANYGGAKHPAWYHNLKANPAATVTIEGNIWDATARLAIGLCRGLNACVCPVIRRSPSAVMLFLMPGCRSRLTPNCQ
jgi:deazaflavin-dependent oxidoreductase (nitroreductase family)